MIVEWLGWVTYFASIKCKEMIVCEVTSGREGMIGCEGTIRHGG